MTQRISVTCFTDLQGSTRLADTLGHQTYMPMQAEYLRVGRALAERVGGRYVKNIGDSHMLTFDDIGQSIDFAAQLQGYYQCQPPNDPQLNIRIGLFLGLIEPTDTDAFGSGVNQASRVQSKAAPGEVILNKELVDNIARFWGPAKTAPYFTTLGEQDIRGINLKQELYSFDWRLYSADNPGATQPGLVYDHLQSAHVDLLNLNAQRLGEPGILIWPVEPRQVVTAINRGQVEIIKLLTLLGWTLLVLIVDCGIQHTPNSSISSRPYSETFYRKLTQYIKTRGITANQHVYLSDIFDPSAPGYSKVQAVFRDFVVELTLQDLLDINHKEYTDTVKAEIRRAPALNCIQPTLSMAAALCLVERASQKGIIVAGVDEKIQWEHLLRFHNGGDQLGAVMNPVLKSDGLHQAQHSRAAPSWPSLASFVAAMESTNLAWWSFLLFAYLPSFPALSVDLGNRAFQPADWDGEATPPAGVTKEEIARKVWHFVDPVYST